MSQTTIERLYAAFERLDGAAMQACYAPDARFDDPVFSLQGREQIGGMWRMLCQAGREHSRGVWRLSVGAARPLGQGWALRWEVDYRFGATGRAVHNVVHTEIELDADGLILRHRDRFDFWRWSRQALGAPGLLLGWTGLLRRRVQQTAALGLTRFLARPPP